MDNKPLNRIKVMMAESMITNKELGKLLGKDPATVSKWVTNTSQPSNRHRKYTVVGVTIPDDNVQKEKVVLKIEVRPNKELESVIFSYFPHVEVLEPETLREEFKEKISNNLQKYLSMQKDCTAELLFCKVN